MVEQVEDKIFWKRRFKHRQLSLFVCFYYVALFPWFHHSLLAFLRPPFHDWLFVKLSDSFRRIIALQVYQHNVYAKGSEFHSFKKVMSEMDGGDFADMELASFFSTSKGYMGEW